MNDIEAIEKRIIEIIAKQAEMDPALFKPESTMDDFDVPSVAQLEAMFAVEEAFNIYMPDDIDDMTLHGLAVTVSKLLDAKQVE